MWIESHPSLSIRRCFVSPPGYQSSALGDSIPVPGSQEAQHETLQPRVSTPTLCCVPQLFASVIPSRIHQEVDNEHRISQWWGHHGLHQYEVLKCLTMEEMQQVSPKKVDCELTTSGLLSQTRTGAFLLGSQIRVSKTTSLSPEPNRDTSYVSHTATLHISSIKTLDTANQFPYMNVWEGFGPNVNQFL